MRKIGEKGDVTEFTMWLCLNGWLRSFRLEMSQKSEVRKQIQKHSIKYMGTTYMPHMSNTMERVVAALNA